jgi:alpha-beta hydrolase superfamily lysophospholipase
VLARILFYSFVVLVAVPLAFSHVLLRGHRGPTAPPSAGFTEAFVLSEGLRIRTWTAAGRPERPAVVIVHGVGDGLESFLDMAGRFRERGHTVLLLDQRAQGGSEGRHVTLGGREREDVRAALDHLRGRGLASAGLVLIGHSMGAVSVLRAAAGRSDVRAVVAEAPYDTYRDTVAQHARILYGLPRWMPIIPLSIAFAEWRAGFDADDVDAVAAARAVQAPLLAIADGADARMPEAVVRRVFDAHPGPKRLWVAPGADHVGAAMHPDYWPTVFGFLAEHGVSRLESRAGAGGGPG